MTIVYRSVKGSRLTSAEVDGNFSDLEKSSILSDRQNDLIINPHGSIQQETTTPVSISAGGAVYFADQWLGNQAGSGFTVQYGVTTGTVSDYDPCHMFAKVTATKASLVAGDVAIINSRFEGRYFRKLLFGGSTARSSWIRFKASATQSCTISVAVRNGANNRSYVTTFAVTTTPTVFSFLLPGDTTGTWPTDNTWAADLCFSIGAGTTWQTSTLNAWQSGNFVAANSQTNLLAVSNAQLNVTDVSWKPSQILLPFQSIDWAQELVRCQRYWESTYLYGISPNSSSTFGRRGYNNWSWQNQGRSSENFSVSKRTSPTVTLYGSTGTGAGTAVDNASSAYAVSVTYSGERGFEFLNNSGATQNGAFFHFVANARL